MKTRICSLIKKCYPGIQLEVIFRSSIRIQSSFPLKDRIPSLNPLEKYSHNKSRQQLQIFCWKTCFCLFLQTSESKEKVQFTWRQFLHSRQNKIRKGAKHFSQSKVCILHKVSNATNWVPAGNSDIALTGGSLVFRVWRNGSNENIKWGYFLIEGNFRGCLYCIA